MRRPQGVRAGATLTSIPEGGAEIMDQLASAPLQPLVALIAGILILISPRLLNYIVAIYLLFVGITGLLPQL
jgi:hypothetical protein